VPEARRIAGLILWHMMMNTGQEGRLAGHTAANAIQLYKLSTGLHPTLLSCTGSHNTIARGKSQGYEDGGKNAVG
jgi:hypothetical protein